MHFTSELSSGIVSRHMSEPSNINILVVGSGGREHALVQKCLQSPLTGKIIASPGNGGMAADVDCFDVQVEDIDGLVELAKAQSIGLVVVGPEVPLSLGLVDAMSEAGVPAYGPKRQGAQLESFHSDCSLCDFHRGGPRPRLPRGAPCTDRDQGKRSCRR